jgi:hypothetical protein
MGKEGRALPCGVCEEPQTHDRHMFEDTNGKTIAQYCDQHCPRCFHGGGDA